MSTMQPTTQPTQPAPAPDMAFPDGETILSSSITSIESQFKEKMSPTRSRESYDSPRVNSGRTMTIAEAHAALCPTRASLALVRPQ